MRGKCVHVYFTLCVFVLFVHMHQYHYTNFINFIFLMQVPSTIAHIASPAHHLEKVLKR